MAPERPADGLAAVAATGDKAATLRALRDALASDYEGAEYPRDRASLAARLADVLDRIDALPAEKKGTPLDELGARRAAGDGIAPRTTRAGRR